MYNHRGVSLLETPWHVNVDEDFEEAFRSCEIVVELAVGAHVVVLCALAYDRRPRGSTGRALTRSIPGTPLQVGGRVEPIPDVATCERISNCLARVTFWRPSSSTLAHFRSPLWDAALVLTPTLAPAVDLFEYALCGPIHQWCMRVIWIMLNVHIWGRSANTDFEA